MAVLNTVLCALLLAVLAHGQRDLDTFGTYFRMAFIDNFVDYPIYRPVDLYVCSKAVSTNNRVNVTIPYLNDRSCPTSTVQNISPGDCKRFELCEQIRHTYADGSLAKKVVEIFSEYDISVQGFNVEKFSADSYAILPWDLNGHQYYVMSYTLQSIQTQFAIVCKETTKIRIVIPDRAGETLTVDYNGLRYTNGETFVFELEPETTFLAQSPGDLTGVMIQSSRKIAVFTGNVRSFNDFNQTSRDHLVEQVPGIVRWGVDFIYIPTPRSTLGDTLKIIAYMESTRVELINRNGVSEITVGRAPTVLNLTMVTHIRARRSILVAVFVRSQEGKEAGITDPADPSMYFLPSVSQYGEEFYLPRFKDAEREDYQVVWLLLAVHQNNERDVMIDRRRLDQSELTSLSRTLALPYRTAVVKVRSDEVHRVTLNNNAGNRRKMMVVAYGASDRESFASTLGYSFEDLGCEETDMLEIPDNIDNDCDGNTDEETCGDNIDNDSDGLLDEDCKDEVVPKKGGDATGTTFAIVFMSNVVKDLPIGDYIDQIELYIAPLEVGTRMSITAPAYSGPNKPQFNGIRASPGSVLQIPLHPNMRPTPAGSIRLGRSSITNKGLRIESNKNIVVYGINKKQFSTDGFLALPITVLGSEYYAFCNYPIIANDDRCQFAVVAVKDNTNIRIDVPLGVTLDAIDNGSPIIGPTTARVRLDSYQVLEIQSLHDITGTRVYSVDDIHFSFFSGNVRTRVPLSKTSRDHLVEQLPSTDTWGKSFATMSSPRDEEQGDLFKIVCQEDNTRFNLSYFGTFRRPMSNNYMLHRGGHDEFFVNFSTPVYIQSDKPILVIQITKSATKSRDDNDPSAIVVVPENRWSKNYRFVTPLSGQRDGNGNQLSFNNYVIITVRKEHRQGLFLTDVHGNQNDIGRRNDWQEMPGDSSIEGLVYRLPRGQGQTAISNLNPDAKWMALIFGRADRETYGNAIGLSFAPHDGSCTDIQMMPGDGIDNDCDGKIDEELDNNIDDDGDGKTDEDTALPPTGYNYILAFEDNYVEYPRNYALEIYVGPLTDSKVTCRMETPGRHSAPSYDITTVVHDPSKSRQSDKIQFAVSSALRTRGTSLHYTSILMTCDRPVTLMGVNKETFSADAFVVLEERNLDMEYYTVSFSPATLKTQFAVIAVKNGTTNVEINTKAPISWNGNSVSFVNLRLSKYQVFQAQSKQDLTGSHITANKPIAVFSGNIRTMVSLSASRDHLAAQLPPVSAWGSRFHLVPTAFRTVGDLFRVVARRDDTRISWDGRSSILARAGDYTQIDTGNTGAFLLEATRDVMVMHIVKSQAAAYINEASDPCSLIISPMEQYTNVSSVITPLYSRGFYKNGEHFQNYLTLIIPTQSRNGVRINGMSIGNNPDISYLNGAQERPIDNYYVALDLTIQKQGLGTYLITHTNSNTRFSGYLVGVADRESYCIPIARNHN